MFESLGDELLVFDPATSRAHSLNATAAAVWHACNGSRSRGQISQGCGLAVQTVDLALADLAQAHLLLDSRKPDRMAGSTAGSSCTSQPGCTHAGSHCHSDSLCHPSTCITDTSAHVGTCAGNPCCVEYQCGSSNGSFVCGST